jgi:hypothetical protein
MSGSPRVLFFSVYNSWLVHNQVDAVLASTLRIRGAEVAIVSCQGEFQNCLVAAQSLGMESLTCTNCIHDGNAFFHQLFDLPGLSLTSFITPESQQLSRLWSESLQPEEYNTAKFGEIPVGEWVLSAILSYFRISLSELHHEHVRRVHRRYLHDGLLTYLACIKMFEKWRPEHLVLFNGRMLPYRVALEAARSKDINVLVHERGLIDGSFAFFSNSTCLDRDSPYALIHAWMNLPLVEEQLLRTKQYFIRRENGFGMNWPAFYAASSDHRDLRRDLCIPEGARIFSVFTSSEDELGNTFQGSCDQLSVIDGLIDIFADRPEYLVIRHHPHTGGSIQLHSNTPPATGYIDRAISQLRSLPANVRVIMPWQPITSYALLWHTDAALAFYSTVAIEAIARGVAVACHDNSAYQIASTLTFEDASREQLALLVQSLLDHKFEVADLRRLYRFTDAYFFKFSVIFRTFGIRDHHSFDLRFQDMAGLLPGKDPALDRLCDHLLNGVSFLQLPSPDDIGLDPGIETHFLEKELTYIRSYRAELQCHNPSPIPTTVGVLSWQGESQVAACPNWQNDCVFVSLRHDLPLCDALAVALENLEVSYIILLADGWQYDPIWLTKAKALLAADPNVIACTLGLLHWNETTATTQFCNPEHFAEDLMGLELLEMLAIAVFRRDALKQLCQSEDLYCELRSLYCSDMTIRTSLPYAWKAVTAVEPTETLEAKLGVLEPVLDALLRICIKNHPGRVLYAGSASERILLPIVQAGNEVDCLDPGLTDASVMSTLVARLRRAGFIDCINLIPGVPQAELPSLAALRRKAWAMLVCNQLNASSLEIWLDNVLPCVAQDAALALLDCELSTAMHDSLQQQGWNILPCQTEDSLTLVWRGKFEMDIDEANNEPNVLLLPSPIEVDAAIRARLVTQYELGDDNVLLFPQWNLEDEELYKFLERVLDSLLELGENAPQTILMACNTQEQERGEEILQAVLFSLFLQKPSLVELGHRFLFATDLTPCEWMILSSCCQKSLPLSMQSSIQKSLAP